jgi:ribosomal-protein-alanine N-acetyltransferase
MSAAEDGDIELLPLTASDLKLAAALHEACFEDSWDAAALARLLAMSGSVGMLALIERQPVGLVIARGTEDEAEILTLGVLPAYRRRGVATLLLECVGELSGEAGRTRLLLEVAEDNAAARALYDKARFVQVGRRLDYYRRGPEGKSAAIVLARTLRSRPD